MRRVLTKSFFNRPTPTVARELLGKYLVRRTHGAEHAYFITETEAYDGFNDKASHAYRGKTPRNEVMFGHPGRIYVYFTYGMHYMLNIITREEGYPAAVLIRALEGVNGPGRLTKRLCITKTLNKKFLSKENGLWVEERGVILKNKDIRTAPRVGIPRAEEWMKKPYRFILDSTSYR